MSVCWLSMSFMDTILSGMNKANYIVSICATDFTDAFDYIDQTVVSKLIQLGRNPSFIPVIGSYCIWSFDLTVVYIGNSKSQSATVTRGVLQ